MEYGCGCISSNISENKEKKLSMWFTNLQSLCWCFELIDSSCCLWLQIATFKTSRLEDSRWSKKARFWPRGFLHLRDFLYLCAHVSMSSKLGYVFVLYVNIISDNLWIFWSGILKWYGLHGPVFVLYVMICATWILLGHQIFCDESNCRNGDATSYPCHCHVIWGKKFMTFFILHGICTVVQPYDFATFLVSIMTKNKHHHFVTLEQSS